MNPPTALLIIDVQKGMFSPPDPIFNGQELLKILANLIARARAEGVPVVYVQHSAGPGDLLHPQAPGWPLHPAIAPQPGEVVVHKFHPDSFQDTSLHQQLQQGGIQHLVVAGMQTEYCVDTTCRRAYSLGYSVTLVQDGHSTWNNHALSALQIIAHHNETLAGGFVHLQTAHEVIFSKSKGKEC